MKGSAWKIHIFIDFISGDATGYRAWRGGRTDREERKVEKSVELNKWKERRMWKRWGLRWVGSERASRSDSRRGGYLSLIGGRVAGARGWGAWPGAPIGSASPHTGSGGSLARPQKQYRIVRLGKKLPGGISSRSRVSCLCHCMHAHPEAEARLRHISDCNCDHVDQWRGHRYSTPPAKI